MYVTDWTFANAVAQDSSVGTLSWTDPENAIAITDDGFGNDEYALLGTIGQDGSTFRTHDIRLVVGGAIVGTNETDDSLTFGFPSTNTYGDNTTDFGEDVSGYDMSRSDFGIAIAMCKHTSGGSLNAESYYLVMTDFGFDIPADAFLAGVEVEVQGNRAYAGPGVDYMQLNYVKIRVYYDLVINWIGKGKSYGFAQFNEEVELPISQKKQYQYLAYENNVFVGQWRDVETVPSLQMNVNELPGELPVTLARNLDSVEVEYDEIELSGYTDEVLVTLQNNEVVLAGEEVAYGIGAGTDLEVNHTVKVKEYYGGYEDLITLGGEPILTSNLEKLQVPNGYPRSRS